MKTYIIEQADPKYPDSVIPNRFLCVRGSYDGRQGTGNLSWTSEAQFALRFAFQKDAAMFVGMIQELFDQLPLSKTLPGLRSNEPRAIVVEHLWND